MKQLSPSSSATETQTEQLIQALSCPRVNDFIKGMKLSPSPPLVDPPGLRALSVALFSRCLWRTTSAFLWFVLMSGVAMISVILRLFLMALGAVERVKSNSQTLSVPDTPDTFDLLMFSSYRLYPAPVPLLGRK